MNKTWYILRGEMKYGPYEHKTIMTMLEKGEIQDYNYVWTADLSKWTLVGDVPEFANSTISEFAAAEIKVPVYAHNEHHFFDGECTAISPTGAILQLNTPLLVPGQDFLLHFKKSNQNPEGFNLITQVIRKTFTKQRIKVNSALHYAVRFLQVPDRGHKFITEMIKQRG